MFNDALSNDAQKWVKLCWVQEPQGSLIAVALGSANIPSKILKNQVTKFRGVTRFYETVLVREADLDAALRIFNEESKEKSNRANAENKSLRNMLIFVVVAAAALMLLRCALE